MPTFTGASVSPSWPQQKPKSPQLTPPYHTNTLKPVHHPFYRATSHTHFFLTRGKFLPPQTFNSGHVTPIKGGTLPVYESNFSESNSKSETNLGSRVWTMTSLVRLGYFRLGYIRLDYCRFGFFTLGYFSLFYYRLGYFWLGLKHKLVGFRSLNSIRRKSTRTSAAFTIKGFHD